MSLVRSSSGPIGLDIGARSIRALQLDHAGPGGRVTGAVAFPRLETGPGAVLPTRAEVERIAQVLRRNGIHGGRLIAGLPDEKLLASAFELSSAGAPVETISRVELARTAGAGAAAGPQSLEVAAWQLPKPDRGRETSHVLAVGCLHADADAFLDALETAGLAVHALDARPLALARACEPITAARSGIATLVEVDWAGTMIVLLFQGKIIYQRSTAEIGAPAALKAVQEHLGLEESLARRLLCRPGGDTGLEPARRAAQLAAEHADHLGEEIALAISYASNRYADAPADLTLLAGEAARMSGLATRLAERLGTVVRPVTPRELVPLDPGLERAGENPGLVAALGLAAWPGGAAA